MKKLTGSEKQIKWAESIRKEMIEEVDMQAMNHIIPMLRGSDSQNAADTMESIKSKLTQDTEKNNEMILHTIKEIIENEEKATTFISNQSLLGFLNEYFG